MPTALTLSEVMTVLAQKALLEMALHVMVGLENPSNNFALILNFTQILTSALILIASPVILMPPATILLVALHAPV